MRIYNDPVEMIKEVERDLFEMGIRYQSATVQDQNVENNPGYQTIELSGYGYALTGFDWKKFEEMVSYMGNSLPWAILESKERLFGKHPLNPGTAWKADEAKWGKFIRNGCFSYSYAERWRAQIEYVIHELKVRPNTRQAVMTMYDVHQDMMNWGGLDRVPCSLTYQFLQRDGKLTLIYNERSCDFLSFFSTDVYTTCILLEYASRRIGAKVDRFVHFIGSLHAFAKDLEGRSIF